MWFFISQEEKNGWQQLFLKFEIPGGCQSCYKFCMKSINGNEFYAFINAGTVLPMGLISPDLLISNAAFCGSKPTKRFGADSQASKGLDYSLLQHDPQLNA